MAGNDFIKVRRSALSTIEQALLCSAGPDAPAPEMIEAALRDVREAMADPAAVEKPIGYLRADLENKPVWGEDCVCEDAVYPASESDFDFDGSPLVKSLPVFTRP